MIYTKKRVCIKDGWVNSGRRGSELGCPVEVNGQRWTPVLFDDEEDPDFFKTSGLRLCVEEHKLDLPTPDRT